MIFCLRDTYVQSNFALFSFSRSFPLPFCLPCIFLRGTAISRVSRLGSDGNKFPFFPQVWWIYDGFGTIFPSPLCISFFPTVS